LLNELDAAGESANAVRVLFGTELPDHLADLKLKWRTQYVIPLSAGSPFAGRRPDLVAEGKRAFLIIENKVGAGFTSYQALADDEPEEQVFLYKRYLDTRPEPFKCIKLLTYATLKPQGWEEAETCAWIRLNEALKKWITEELKDSAPAAALIGRQLCLFLEDYGMGTVELGLSDIAALSSWNRLHDACVKLGERVPDSILEARPERAGFDRTSSLGKEFEHKFFGKVFTQGGIKVENAAVCFWGGVLTGVVYGAIAPKTVDVPEFTVGFYVWGDRKRLEEIPRFDQMVQRLNDQSDGRWSREAKDDPNPKVTATYIIVSSTISFLDVIKHNSEWGDEADEFYRSRFQDLASLDAKDLEYISGWEQT
jgi:hypothetical protein